MTRQLTRSLLVLDLGIRLKKVLVLKVFQENFHLKFSLSSPVKIHFVFLSSVCYKKKSRGRAVPCQTRVKRFFFLISPSPSPSPIIYLTLVYRAYFIYQGQPNRGSRATCSSLTYKVRIACFHVTSNITGKKKC